MFDKGRSGCLQIDDHEERTCSISWNNIWNFYGYFRTRRRLVHSRIMGVAYVVDWSLHNLCRVYIYCENWGRLGLIMTLSVEAEMHRDMRQWLVGIWKNGIMLTVQFLVIITKKRSQISSIANQRAVSIRIFHTFRRDVAEYLRFSRRMWHGVRLRKIFKLDASRFWVLWYRISDFKGAAINFKTKPWLHNVANIRAKWKNS